MKPRRHKPRREKSRRDGIRRDKPRRERNRRDKTRLDEPSLDKRRLKKRRLDERRLEERCLGFCLKASPTLNNGLLSQKHGFKALVRAFVPSEARCLFLTAYSPVRLADRYAPSTAIRHRSLPPIPVFPVHGAWSRTFARRRMRSIQHRVDRDRLSSRM